MGNKPSSRPKDDTASAFPEAEAAIALASNKFAIKLYNQLENSGIMITLVLPCLYEVVEIYNKPK